ncbi:MAG TPA: redoxin domain-containing protein [Candidatus Dormibacteraeota bacterium]|nr:redoxin domain-containing protein [Candidatus Dormibacteraeota bacterium]
MSHRSAPRPAPGHRKRETARRRAARARRLALTVGGLIALAIAVLAFGLHQLSQGAPASAPAASAGAGSGQSGSPMGTQQAVGQPAPDGTFTTLTGQTERVASLRGQPTLLWFVTTWCDSCQAGTRTMAAQLDALRATGVRVVELELYQDLGQPGPSLPDFVRTYAQTSEHDPGWTFGSASRELSQTYDPQSYLDIYYLLDAQGRIVYVNSSPSASMPELLAQARALR